MRTIVLRRDAAIGQSGMLGYTVPQQLVMIDYRDGLGSFTRSQ